MRSPGTISPVTRFTIVAIAAICYVAELSGAARFFNKGDLVHLSRSETLLFQGQNFLGAPKGQEFIVLQQDIRQGLVYVPFIKADGTLIAVTLPADALEASPRDAWIDLLRGVEAFRDQRFDEAKRLLLSAARDPQYRAIAGAVSARINGAILTFQQAPAGRGQQLPGVSEGLLKIIQSLRETTDQLCNVGYPSLALPLDEGADRLGATIAGNTPGTTVPAAKIDRGELTQRVAASNRSLARCRQAVALHRLTEASKYIDEGLKAEPARPELKAIQTRIQKDLDEAEENYKAADRMRRFDKGAVHALTALERGLKACVDHPRLLELRKEMQGLFEERTSPPITPALVAAAGKGTSMGVLEEGRSLYTTRCTECHDLELLDSRSITGWQKAVASMAGRAHLNDSQQAKLLSYLAAAQNGLGSEN